MIRFLIKGLMRDRSRSLFPILMVSAGVFLTVFLYSYLNGAIGDMVDAAARFNNGHLKVTSRAYSELESQMPNDLALMEAGEHIRLLKEEYPNIKWVERIRFGGLLDMPDELDETRAQGPVFGMAIDLLDPSSEDVNILGIEKSIVRGRKPEKANEILISEEFALKLGAKPGDKATLLSSTMNGSMAMHNFYIAGTIRFGMIMLDKSTIIVDIRDARFALDMEDAASEILGFIPDMVYDHKGMEGIMSAYNKKYSKEEGEFSPYMLRFGDQGIMKDMLVMVNFAAAIMVSIFVLAMSVVLWNAGLMNGIRRYGEIGIRLAMGEPKGAIFRAMIMESVVLGIAGSILGTAFGLAASYYLQYVGFDITDMLQKSSVMMSSVIRAKVSITSYYIGFFPGVFASVLGTLFAGIGIYKRQTSQLFKELEV
ncbi:MAG: FtsX-like permease family protein [Deltaproteobacteria bacterium]|nr:FtsX-like permease family protein [Deltaproteobacteria bacterium]